ncbi:MAG: extracellular solute-binding protein [Halothiobacillus sp.]
MFNRIFGILGFFALAISSISSAQAQETLYVYGPGGPAPAMMEAAAAFEKMTGTKVEVTAGPTPKWIEQAKTQGDVIFSGSENMMTDFTNQLEGQIKADQVIPLYLRPMAILVRPGNPNKIKGFKDILKPGTKVLVVQGAGQTGAWEDIAGRLGSIKTVKALRSNIVAYANNSALAKQAWINQPDIDAWLIYNIWQVANPKLADVVKIEPQYAIYRDAGVVLTQRAEAKPEAKAFIAFLQSKQGEKIFVKWGWKAN